MQTQKTTTIPARRYITAAVLGALTLAPLVTNFPAQAEPPRRGDARRILRTLEGVVTKDRAGRDFTLATRRDNRDTHYRLGTRIRVHLLISEPRNLDQDDLVRVTGYFTRDNVFEARSITIVRHDYYDRNGGANNRRTVTGTVITLERNARRLSVRADNGRIYTVFSQGLIHASIDRGDEVRVTGQFRTTNANTIREATVVLIDNDNDRNDREVNVNFDGTVTSSNDRDTLRVRATNGRDYVVRTNDAEDYDRGERIRVRGKVTNGVVFVDDIDKR